MKENLKVVICGGGVIGSSISYYLTLIAKQHNKKIEVTIVEKVALACSASGKAGGFLARDWCDGQSTQTLARKSFDLHSELADQLKGSENYGYRRLDTLQVVANDEIDQLQRDLPKEVDWLDEKLNVAAQKIGGTETTAQLTPGEFALTLIEEAKKRGLSVKIGEVKGFDLNPSQPSQICGVEVCTETGEETLPCDIVILSMGSWSSSLNPWFRNNLPANSNLSRHGIQITGQRAHSVIFKPENRNQKEHISAHALFTTTRFNGEAIEFEVYPRIGEDVYVCGQQDTVPLPAFANQINPSELKTDRLIDVACKLIPSLSQGYNVVRQACYLPYSGQGPPIIGKAPELENLFIAAGHSCWGILNAPATGLSLAELILLGKSTIDLTPFKP